MMEKQSFFSGYEEEKEGACTEAFTWLGQCYNKLFKARKGVDLNKCTLLGVNSCYSKEAGTMQFTKPEASGMQIQHVPWQGSSTMDCLSTGLPLCVKAKQKGLGKRYLANYASYRQ